MYRDSYHMLVVHAPPPTGSGERWATERLADARAELLHRLGLSSAGLRVRGLRLMLEPPPPPEPVRLPLSARLAITLRVVAVDDHVAIAEALHSVTNTWHRHWQGLVRVRVAEGGVAVPLPADLYRRATAWLGLVRGTVPADNARREAWNPG